MTHLKKSLSWKNIPYPVLIPFVTVVIGAGLSSIWCSGYASFSLKFASISCLLGGASLWYWIGLKIYDEQQRIENYECIPLTTEDLTADDIDKWFRRTRVRENKKDKRWMRLNIISFFGYTVLALILLHTKYFADKNCLIYAFSIAFYIFTCVLNPAHYMVDDNEQSQ